MFIPHKDTCNEVISVRTDSKNAKRILKTDSKKLKLHKRANFFGSKEIYNWLLNGYLEMKMSTLMR